MNILILVSFSLFSFNAVQFSCASTINETDSKMLITINAENVNFFHALDLISKQSGITIRFHGKQPLKHHNVAFLEVELEYVLRRLLKQYHVRSYVITYSTRANSITDIDLYEYQQSNNISKNVSSSQDHSTNSVTPLTERQRKLLIQDEQFSSNLDENMLPLTFKQLSELSEYSNKFEQNTNHNPLSLQEIEKLELQSEKEHHDREPLSPKQMNDLNAIENKAE